MPNIHSGILKSTLEDEQSIELEKYLLLPKKYFPVFKKMFPNIGAYELSVIAKSCLPSFDQVKLERILPILKKLSARKSLLKISKNLTLKVMICPKSLALSQNVRILKRYVRMLMQALQSLVMGAINSI